MNNTKIDTHQNLMAPMTPLSTQVISDPWSDVIKLEGKNLSLVPLSKDHLEDLNKNLLYKNAWHSLTWGTVTKDDLEKGIERSFKARAEKLGNAFTIIQRIDNQAVGMTRLLHFDRPNNGIEVGGTWIGQNFQKTFVNTECKFLILRHCFEYLKVQRVELRADSLNFNSQKAILRIGAKYEGELRNTCLLPDGRKRDYKVFSIIDSEWVNIKLNLIQMMEKYV